MPVPQATVSGHSGSVWRTSTKQEGESVAHVAEVSGSGKMLVGPPAGSTSKTDEAGDSSGDRVSIRTVL